ncbi:uncharacterized protein LOC131346306 isoform X2 [Hemibagrus wyckioides]|uniref:uncharacterized protein LOC131346306 isoform X2 n=1 Tax=Hemibagrus wyckioides TaxID=337641 RepID=UPI00266C36BD|nr:uncharacterized protein LOC131346306 isoform X2 [Hemibagrus wyckioides]
MATDLGWTSGHTSSTDITIISILFLVVYITLYALCTTCFRKTPECPEEKEKPSSLSLSVNREDQRSRNRTTSNVDVLSSTAHSDVPQVPAGPHHQDHNVVYNQQTNINSHNRGQQDKTVWECVTPPPEDISSVFTETVSEEHPYECIDNLRVSGPSSPSFCDEADEEQWESESPYHMVTEWTETADDYDLSTLLSGTDSENELKFIFPPLPAVPDEKINTNRTALYAEVNWKNKSRRSTEEAPVEQDTVVPDEEEAPPPVPEKIFD